MQTNPDLAKPEAANLYRNYVLAMLTLVYVFNFIDRQLLVILQESIKKELHLSDTQLGFLTGFAFAIFYVLLGIPIARMADKGSRRNTVTASLALWSVMTAVSGRARNFVQLALARIGVGVGEAGCSPPAHAMISDYFPPARRSTALSIYSAGIYFGILIGFLMGGYLNQHLGWRVAFYAVGVPGVIFSVLVYATVKEPRRGATDEGVSGQRVSGERGTGEGVSFWEGVKKLYAIKTFVWLALGASLHVFCIYGLLNWAPSFLIRLHGMKSPGLVLGPIFGIGGALGSFAGGALTDHFGKRDRRLYVKIPAFAILLSVFLAAGAIFAQSTTLCLVCLGGCVAMQSTYLGPSITIAHSLVPASMRSFTSAVFFLAINLIGLGCGPTVVGLLSDKLAPSLGVESLRWAMSIVIVVGLAAVGLFLKTIRTMASS
jgi:MFS family permease